MKGVLVTGAARRVGAAIAEALGADGWRVVVHYNSSADDAEATAARIRDAGGEAITAQADLSAAGSIDGLFATLDEDGIRLEALVNNASLFRNDTVASMTMGSWNDHLAVNLTAPVLLSKLFAERLEADTVGCIVNLLDNKVFATNPDFFSYTISKLALQGATETLALAFAPRVRVCGIAPGITLISGKQTRESFERAHRLNPLGRGCTPDQIVGAVRFVLATPALTGHTIVIDGGESLQRPGRDVSYRARGPA